MRWFNFCSRTMRLKLILCSYFWNEWTASYDLKQTWFWYLSMTLERNAALQNCAQKDWRNKFFGGGLWKLFKVEREVEKYQKKNKICITYFHYKRWSLQLKTLLLMSLNISSIILHCFGHFIFLNILKIPDLEYCSVIITVISLYHVL